MPPKPRNIGASVRARLLDRARVERSDFQILLTRYALERLLYRLSVSAHRERFILKGAMLFVTWVTDPFRPTRDLDLLGHGDNDVEAIADTFRSICAEPVADDGVVFDHAGMQAAPIREEMEYGGVWVRTTATIAGARVPIQVDVGFGDVVTPAAVEIDYPTLLGNPAPHLRAYPVETVVAEKFEALTTLGIANSRLKDFYDLWLIAQKFEFRQRGLIEAVQRTFDRRGTAAPLDTPVGLTDEFAAARAAQWRAFLGRERMATKPRPPMTQRRFAGWQICPHSLSPKRTQARVRKSAEPRLGESIRSQLTPAQEAFAIFRRKAIYEELRPETKAGAAGASARWNGKDANENSAFASATSDAIGKSRRSVEISAARGEALGDDLGAITGTSLDKGVELDRQAASRLHSNPRRPRHTVRVLSPSSRRRRLLRLSMHS